MKINQSDTAIECFHELPPELFNRQENNVAHTIIAKNKFNLPITISTLSKTCGYDKSTMSRILNSLIKKTAIIIYKKDVCPISGKRVRWYRINPEFKPKK